MVDKIKVGETLVLVAHPAYRKVACQTLTNHPDNTCKECDGSGFKNQAAIFHAFIPTRIEYIVKGTETDEKLERLEKRGVTLIKLVRTNEKE